MSQMTNEEEEEVHKELEILQSLNQKVRLRIDIFTHFVLLTLPFPRPASIGDRPPTRTTGWTTCVIIVTRRANNCIAPKDTNGFP
jgi:hypothetical protein